MATNIPPHNLTEVMNATIEMVNDPTAGLETVLKHVQGPDFPTGGYIYGKGGIVNAYKTGRGRFLMRAKCAQGKHLRWTRSDHRERDSVPGEQVQTH
jgi:DNA gyrase subunit A